MVEVDRFRNGMECEYLTDGKGREGVMMDENERMDGEIIEKGTKVRDSKQRLVPIALSRLWSCSRPAAS